MDGFTEEQAEYIKKLSKANDIFQKIIEKDPKGLILHGSNREKLMALRKKTKDILAKLQSREFTVAIVGLEKAGKSTVANALLQLSILPEDTERCTFTTTEIRAGETNRAEVQFYTRSEFDRQLQGMLEALEYKHEATLDTLSLATFNAFWQRQERENPSLYREHDTKEAADIRAIIEGRDILDDMMRRAQELVKFNEEQLHSGEFKKYVTGYSSDERDAEGVRICKRQAYPYGVKKVVIYSAELKEMRNIVLYDVPGFDSPTKLHKQQTEEQLKEADAIILVTKVTTPSLTGPQLDMLNKVYDNDGILLNEKAFVFGNQLDLSGNAELARGNIGKLRREVQDNHLADDRRVICGSARAALERKGIKPNDARIKLTGAPALLDSWGLSDGVDELYKGMQEYYNHDRFAILKKRADKAQNEAKRFLEDIIDEFTPGSLDNLDTGTGDAMRLYSRLKVFVQEASKKRDAYVQSIWTEAPFSKRLEENIETIFPYQDEENPSIQKNYLSGDVDGTQKITKIDTDIRNELQVEFTENIVRAMAEVTVGYEQKFWHTLIDTFLSSLGMPKDSPEKEELQKNVDALFHKLLVKGGEECRFNSLVERFITSPIEVLIGHPYGSEERYNKLAKNAPMLSDFNEFRSLAVYYYTDDFNNDDKEAVNDRIVKELSIFSRALLHKDTQTFLYHENRNELNNVAKGLKEAGSLALDFMPFGKWTKLFIKSGISLADKDRNHSKQLETSLKRIMRNPLNHWDTSTKEERRQLLDSGVEEYARSHSLNAHLDMRAVLAHMQEEARKTVRLDSRERIFEFLNKDIEILRDITTRSVRYAMGLERAFVSSIQKNVDIICKSTTDDENLEDYIEWIKKNMWHIHPERGQEVLYAVEMNASREEIIKAIRSLLNEF